MPQGTVHDEGDPGEMQRNGIGYIYVTDIHGEAPSKIQLIPFIQKDTPIGESKKVKFKIGEYNLNPTTKKGDEGTIRIAIDVTVR